MPSRLVGAGLCTMAGFASGFWLWRIGKPYGVLVLTLHKLVTLAAAAFYALAIIRIGETAPLGAIDLIFRVVAGVLFLITVATGGLVSAGKTALPVVRALHKIAPFLTVPVAAIGMLLLLGRAR
jgi:hypothetical protein